MSEKQDKIKLGIAVGALVVAGVLLAGYYTNWFRGDSPKPLPAPTAEEKQELDEATKVNEQIRRDFQNNPNVQETGK